MSISRRLTGKFQRKDSKVLDKHDLKSLTAALLLRESNTNYVGHLITLSKDEEIDAALFLEICVQNKQKQAAFRAAWVLEHIATFQPERFAAVLPNFCQQLAIQANDGCQRHFTKILMYMTDHHAPAVYRDFLETIDKEELIVAVMFEWLINPKTLVATQVNCMDILYNLSHEYDWIASELQAQITFLLKTGTAAMQSRGKKILGKLRPLET